ncbi:hypothetical protein PIB30_097393 [Stylosanthes scabra]|uniref:Uncharacterized protein n=1 Tax=Stylosanthes scabra TaxID=79078 RepID=A0ABU6TYT3_9FABA|nr:hypothetical protein [Stylosanthes scabra]
MDGNPTAMNGQGWEPCQVGYDSDSSNDRYFSCEDSLSAYQIDDVEFHHRARFEAMFEGLVQERDEIMEGQKRIEVQLLTVAELVSSVMRQFAHFTSPCQEEGWALSLCTQELSLRDLPVKVQTMIPLLPREEICRGMLSTRKHPHRRTRNNFLSK